MLASFLLLASLTTQDTVSRAIRYYVDVPAPIATVWSAWTEPNRVKEWFAQGSNIELKTLGKYEILFAPNAPPGLRGAENNVVLAFQAPEMLAFTWDAPPNFPAARAHRTSVVVRLRPIHTDTTRVWFEQTGWGRGGEWDTTYDYFQVAWKSVLALLHRRYTSGPIDWSGPINEAALGEHMQRVRAW
jgi:uncharacterized protein YndB with AHSA1/START domain